MKFSSLLIRALFFFVGSLAFQVGRADAQAQAVFLTGNFIPPLEAYYTNSAPVFGSYLGGAVIIRRLGLAGTSSFSVPPALGNRQTNSFSADFNFELSFDGGATFQSIQTAGSATMSLNHTADVSGTNFFAVELLSLNVSGGTLPTGMMLRESPTLASTGTNAVSAGAGGYFTTSSFSAYTEFSIDGGATWSPSASPPGGLSIASDRQILTCLTNLTVMATDTGGALVICDFAGAESASDGCAPGGGWWWIIRRADLLFPSGLTP